MRLSLPRWRLRSSSCIYMQQTLIIKTNQRKKKINKELTKIMFRKIPLVLEMGALTFSDCNVLLHRSSSFLLSLAHGLQKCWEVLGLWQWGWCCLQGRLAEGTLWDVGVAGTCCEIQAGYVRYVEVLQKYVCGGRGEGIFERSQEKYCSNVKWECY